MAKKDILVLSDELSYSDWLQKRKISRTVDGVDSGAFLLYQSRMEKHLLRGLMDFHLENWVCRRSFSRAEIQLKDYKLIVINELNRAPFPFIQYLRKKNPDCRMVYHYWNSLFHMEQAPAEKRREFEKFIKSREKYHFFITSFDRVDCERYGFIYSPQFIPGWNVPEDWTEGISEEQKTDVFFIGKDKNRLSYVMEIKKLLDDLQLTSCIRIFPDNHHKKYSKEEMKYLMNRKIPYGDVIRQDIKSRAILDVVQDRQQGLTWRAIEALLLKRKLITTFSEIKNYDFYRKGNIFIWGEDDPSQLKNFIETPYQEIEKGIADQYTFRGWLQNLKKYIK